MKFEEIESEVSNIKNLFKEDYKGNAVISLDGYSFDVDNVTDYDYGVKLIAKGKFPRNHYRFTYAMFDPNTSEYRGITHRTYCGVSDEEMLKNKDSYIPGWEDTKYVIIRIERILDESAEIYKNVYENKESMILNSADSSKKSSKYVVYFDAETCNMSGWLRTSNSDIFCFNHIMRSADLFNSEEEAKWAAASYLKRIFDKIDSIPENIIPLQPYTKDEKEKAKSRYHYYILKIDTTQLDKKEISK